MGEIILLCLIEGRNGTCNFSVNPLAGERDCEAFFLRRCFGLTYAKIGVNTGRSLQAVRGSVARVQKLIKSLKKKRRGGPLYGVAQSRAIYLIDVLTLLKERSDEFR